MKKQKYMLTIRYEFEAADDPAARMVAHDLITCGARCPEEGKTKLQRVHNSKQPEKVELPEGW